MDPRSGQLTPRYRVLVEKRARKGLAALVGNRKAEAQAFLNVIAPFTPRERIAGKTKKLKGAFQSRGVLQYDLPAGLPDPLPRGG